jgi:hypothetical protein
MRTEHPDIEGGLCWFCPAFLNWEHQTGDASAVPVEERESQSSLPSVSSQSQTVTMSRPWPPEPAITPGLRFWTCGSGRSTATVPCSCEPCMLICVVAQRFPRVSRKFIEAGHRRILKNKAFIHRGGKSPHFQSCKSLSAI